MIRPKTLYLLAETGLDHGFKNQEGVTVTSPNQGQSLSGVGWGNPAKVGKRGAAALLGEQPLEQAAPGGRKQQSGKDLGASCCSLKPSETKCSRDKRETDDLLILCPVDDAGLSQARATG